MPRKVFFSFHYQPDNWRVAQVRNIGAIEGNRAASDNDWETVKKGGDAAIESWISGQLSGTSCTILLIGENTAGRKWINHEIIKTWDAEKAILGINIHNLKDRSENQAKKGANPFDLIGYGQTGKKLSEFVKVYDPPYYDSRQVYQHISQNIGSWIEEAIQIRSRY